LVAIKTGSVAADEAASSAKLDICPNVDVANDARNRVMEGAGGILI
jgi:hypothetical protein